MAGDLVEALSDLEEERAVALLAERIKAGEDVLALLEEARRGMEIVGERFEKGEYYLSELIYAGEILKRMSESLKEHLPKTSSQRSENVVVMATVRGDVHDIGKNIVIALLEASGFPVIDLGTNVPPEDIIEKLRETGSGMVGLSALLTTAIDSMKETVKAIREAGLGEVKIMIGGAPIDDEARSYTGADAWGRTAQDGVSIVKRWTGYVPASQS